MTGTLGPRGGRRRAGIAAFAGALLVTVLIAAGTMWLSPGDAPAALPAPTAPAHDHAAANAPVPEPSETAAPAVEVISGGVTPVTPPAQDSAGNIPQTSLAAAASRAVTREGAQSLGDAREDVEPSDVMADGVGGWGGCHEAYGAAGQCLPVIPPSYATHVTEMVDAGMDPDSMPHPWTCAEARLLFPDGILVRDLSDPEGLDDDHDGLACEPDR